MVERALRPAALCAWLPGDDAPRHGDASTLPVAADEIAACVRTQERVLRLPPAPAACRCVAVPLAGADPEDAGALAVAAAADRPFAEDDVAFVIAAAALAGQALRQSQRVSRLSVAAGDDTIVGESEPVARARREVDLVAPHADVSVLLVGETGTGKELFARRLHHASGRPGPFVAVNVAAIPAELLESELFGHVKGAFTGATAARTGFFEHAHRGTLFLDEIGEMPKALQAKLLRVSQERRIQRVGDSRSIEVDVRFVAATNADLPARIAANDFRSDLYYRLAGKQVDLPPLRARPGDVALLVRAFLARQGAGPRRVEREAMELLERYAWPGNVRQLESTMRLAAIHAAADGASAIGPEHIDARVRREAAAGVAPVATPSAAGDDAPTTGADPSLADELAAFERALVVKALRRSGGNKREAARRLTWSINTLRDRIERHHIDEGEYRGAASED
jgi:transcriptional regulator with GAF, ATPase, and Fis domain